MGITGVEFEEPYIPPKLRPPRASSGIVTNLFIKLGLGKNPNDAKRAMVITAAGAFIIATYFFTHLSMQVKPLTPEQVEAARAELESATAATTK